MTESAVDTLKRWEHHGATWRLAWRTDDEAVVDLLSCTGERMDQLRSTDAELLAYVARRPSSEHD